MRIAFFTGPLGQPSNTFITNQILETLNYGHSVDVYSGCPANYMPGNLLERIPKRLHPHLRVFYLEPELSLKAIHKKGKYARPLIRTSIKFGSSTLRQTLRHISSFPEETYDVIHAHFGANGRRAAILHRIGYVKGALITTFHAGLLEAQHLSYPKNYYQIVLDESKFLTVGTVFMRDMVLKIGAPSSKIVKIPMPVNLNDFTYRKPNHTCTKIKFITVARLVGWKGHRFAIKALKTFDNEGVPWKYTIVGEGPQRGEIEAQIRSCNLQDKIAMVGACSSEEVIQLLNDHDVLLHPAIEENGVETQGVALAEAAAVGLPIIAFDSGGIPDTVIHHETGVLVESGNQEAFIKAVVELNRDRDSWSRLTQNAHTHVYKHFNTETVEQMRFKLYEAAKVYS